MGGGSRGWLWPTGVTPTLVHAIRLWFIGLRIHQVPIQIISSRSGIIKGILEVVIIALNQGRIRSGHISSQSRAN